MASVEELAGLSETERPVITSNLLIFIFIYLFEISWGFGVLGFWGFGFRV
jgi:hypothetical protein